MSDCNTCKEKQFVSRHTFETEMDRLERVNKRWFYAWLITFLILVGCVVFFFWRESQFETVSTEVVQEVDTGEGSACVSGMGDVYYGEGKTDGQD